MNAAAWAARARALRGELRVIEAEAAIAEARRLAPGNAGIAFMAAQLRYELGHPAAADFAAAVALAPDNLDAVRNRALALASVGAAAEGEAVLADAVAARPLWLEGHRVLASLRRVHGDAGAAEVSFQQALAAHPGHQGLWLGWFGAAAQARDWARAGEILCAAEAALGATRALAVARAFWAVETGDAAAEAALAAVAGVAGDGFLDLARIRFALRRGDAAGALALALPWTTGAMAGQVWPYVHACWRVLGDERAKWLAGPPFLGVIDVGLDAAEIAALAQALRGLHVARAAYAEQSVRGGTQTDRSVLLRHEPVFQRTRAALERAVAGFVAGLPAREAGHPLLGPARAGARISGSWSVRLGPGGFNVVHSHPMGWLSSAFYVALPEEPGAFVLGEPPPELGLGLAPLARVVPRVGQLVLFPAFMWHGTEPIAAGERLNIAFDVAAGAG